MMMMMMEYRSDDSIYMNEKREICISTKINVHIDIHILVALIVKPREGLGRWWLDQYYIHSAVYNVRLY